MNSEVKGCYELKLTISFRKEAVGQDVISVY